MKQLLIITGLLLLTLSGCGSVPQSVDAQRLNEIRKIAVVSFGASTLNQNRFSSARALSFTVSGDDFNILSWGLDDDYAKQLVKKVNERGRFVATSVSYNPQAFASLINQHLFGGVEPHFSFNTEAEFQKLAARNNVDALLALVCMGSINFLSSSPDQIFRRVGLFQNYSDTQSAVYLVANLYLIDGRTGKVLGNGVPISTVLNTGRPWEIANGRPYALVPQIKYKKSWNPSGDEEQTIYKAAVSLIDLPPTDAALNRMFGTDIALKP